MIETNSFNSLIEKIKVFVNNEFIPPFFSVTYGSFAYGTATISSDLDIMTIVGDKNDEMIKRTCNFIIGLHRDYHLTIDNDVSYERKLLVPFSILEQGCEGRCFNFKNNSCSVPPIIMSRNFLDSDELLMRLTLNAITSKNIFLAGDKNLYLHYRKRAFECILKVVSLTEKKRVFTPEQLANYMIQHSDGRKGQWYLGYKDKFAVRIYLQEQLRKYLDVFIDENKVCKQGEYYMFNAEWIKNFVS